MLLFKRGRVIDPASGLDRVTDLLVDQGKILGLGDHLEGEETVDAAGLVIAPGLVDTHVHFRDPGFPHKEDLHSGAQAAARGGVTGVICMANTKPVTDTPERLVGILARAEKEPVRIFQAAAISRGQQGETLTDMAALQAAGAACFSDDGIPLQNAGLVRKAMELGAALDAVLSFHEEDPALLGSPGVNGGAVAKRLGVAGAPGCSEDVLVARDCMLALDTGARVVIQHISSRYAVALVRFARKLGARVEAEVTPHHFSLTQEAVLHHGTMAKMNPPLRTEADRQAILEGLGDGTINLIATDHAPHTTQEKRQEFAQAPSGIVGLETALALGITHLVQKGHLTLPELLRKMSTNPAGLYRLPGGSLREGGPADLVLFDPAAPWTVEGFSSKSENSPFVGQTLTGQVKMTLCRGKVIYRG